MADIDLKNRVSRIRRIPSGLCRLISCAHSALKANFRSTGERFETLLNLALNNSQSHSCTGEDETGSLPFTDSQINWLRKAYVLLERMRQQAGGHRMVALMSRIAESLETYRVNPRAFGTVGLITVTAGLVHLSPQVGFAGDLGLIAASFVLLKFIGFYVIHREYKDQLGELAQELKTKFEYTGNVEINNLEDFLYILSDLRIFCKKNRKDPDLVDQVFIRLFSKYWLHSRRNKGRKDGRVKQA